MRSDDYTFATYRGHNHALVRGVPMGPLFAELFGRANGLMGGKGGSMHITSAEHHMMGSYAIVGAHLPIALGAAWSAQYRKSGQVAVCFFGDGTTNIGAFHEALNMAVVWRAPVVFVCENNQYMEYTPIAAVTAVARPAADRASAYGLEPIVVDGNDAEAVYATAARTLERARSGDGPSLVEAVTYRHGGHSRADPGKYRPDDEVAAWKARDPIPSLRARLLDGGIAESELAGIDDEVKAKVAAAEAEARGGAEPSPDVIETQLWADGGSSWRSDGAPSRG
jgi:pyruvate dehydrogenase E1 component alpha subunit